MRAIKFRGKRLHNGEWVFGWLYSIVPYGDYHERGFMIKEDVGDDYEVDPSTVGQWTGLVDRNGKELYESDIVECESSGVNRWELRVICYDSNQARYKAVPIPLYLANAGNGGWTGFELRGSFEIVGNVFENPDLISP